MPALPQLPRDRQSRDHVSARAAARHHESVGRGPGARGRGGSSRHALTGIAQLYSCFPRTTHSRRLIAGDNSLAANSNCVSTSANEPGIDT